MKAVYIVFITVILLVIIGGVIFLYGKGKKAEEKDETTFEVTQEVINIMKIASTAFPYNQSIPAKYTCDGKNINPPLTISDVADNAKSLALIVDDPDAPAGTWVHWLVWNMDPKTNEIAENSVPQNAVEGTTSLGKPGYGGPCPPSGSHRYFFKLYALDTTLQLSPSSTKEDLEKAMEGHIIDKTELIGLYSRK